MMFMIITGIMNYIYVKFSSMIAWFLLQMMIIMGAIVAVIIIIIIGKLCGRLFCSPPHPRISRRSLCRLHPLCMCFICFSVLTCRCFELSFFVSIVCRYTRRSSRSRFFPFRSHKSGLPIGLNPGFYHQMQ